MPGAKAARLASMIRGVGENRADERQQFRLLAEPALSFLKTVPEIFFQNRIVEKGFNIFVGIRLYSAVHAVTGRKTDPDMLRIFPLVVAAAFLAGGRTWPDADQVDGAVARIVIGVAEKILRGELPVGGEHPFVDADHLGAALAAVAAVERLG